ncbi:MAG: hypothetical protein PVF82_05035 [Gammaproteobacteria bacterium]|jgi:hypothetical protein
MKALFTIRRAVLLLLSIYLLTLILPVSAAALSQQDSQQGNNQQDNSQVIQAFTAQEKPDAVSIEQQTKQLIMFVMGVPLLVLLLVTGGLGIAMGVYGKQVFVAHMVCAGLSMTLAIAHAIVGIVWFYPF